jgi:cation diffusion facilitator family transporter
LFSTKSGASRLLIGVVVGLIALKAVAAWLSGSISIVAQAADSLFDLVAAIITLLAIRMALKPADTEHPYGHGKWEDIAGTVQGILIMAAAGVLIYASIRRILTGTAIELTEIGMAVMGVSIVASIFLSRHLFRVARATRSIALEANARNIRVDIYSAIAVLVGLLAVRLTGLGYIDAAVAIGVAGYIIRLGYQTVSRSLPGLVDTRLAPEQEALIEGCLEAYRDQVAGFHKLRTRYSGSQSYVDLHLVMDRSISLEQAHQICDQVEADIRNRLGGASVTIHLEPCDGECYRCSVICNQRDTAG